MKGIKIFIRYQLLFYGLLAAVYWLIVRPMHQNWGASAQEVSGKMAGDHLISAERVVSTRAITIEAPVSRVWPWIVQTGQNRGGFNSYDWLENLFGAKMVNATTIHPEWQHPQPGDTVYFGKDQPFERLSLVKKNEYYAIGGWTFYLFTTGTEQTRLIIRYPSMKVKGSTLNTIYYYSLFEPIHFIMEAGMMMGIKRKAEKSSGS